MPRVSLTASQKVQSSMEALKRETRHQLKDNGITYTALAEKLDVTPQAISQQFSKGRCMTLEVYLTAQMMLEGRL